MPPDHTPLSQEELAHADGGETAQKISQLSKGAANRAERGPDPVGGEGEE